MKFVFIGLSFFFWAILLVGCIAEGMAASTGVLPTWIVLDRALAGICFLCCSLAFWKSFPAVILIWLAVVLRVLFNWRYAPADYLMQGIVGYAAAAALCLTCLDLRLRFDKKSRPPS